MARMLAEKRQAQITQMLVADGHIKIGTIIEEFNVSSETARKDLLALEERGIARKTHGGAVIVDSYFAGSNVFLNRRMKRNITPKRQIAREAVKMIDDHSTVILDSGSTTYWIAEELTAKKNITVVTNSLTVATVLAEHQINTLVLGGEIHPSNLAAVGQWADLCLKNIRPDVAFIGASSLSVSRGPCVENFPEAHVKWKMMESAEKRYIVADSTKFKDHALIEYAAWGQFDGLITDTGLSSELYAGLSGKVNVVLAET